MNDKKKIGRNEPCPCRSGKKYKKCHGASSQITPPSLLDPLSDPDINKKLEQMKAAQMQREKQQGFGRPIISSVWKGYRFVAVGKGFYYSKTWKTFHDFLAEYIKLVFGKDWCVSEARKDLNDRHIILQWAHLIGEYRKDVLKESLGDVVSSPMTGAVFAYLTLSYNLYLLAHNVRVQERLVKRLKRKNLFYGALYETMVASYFVKAGFTIELEDEYDGSVTHCEFVAVSKKTGNKYSIEAKTRCPEKADFSIRNQLHKALKKEAAYRRVIFIDLNVSHNFDPMDKRVKWLQDVIGELRTCEASLTVHRNPAPEAYVFITNTPFISNLDSFGYAPAAVGEGFKIPDFRIDSEFYNLRDALNSRDKHIDMLDLMKSMKEYGGIPCTWDGEIPEYAFGEIKEPRLKIGNKYLIPDDSSKEVVATLEDVVVMETERKTHELYRLDNGEQIMLTGPLSDKEFNAFKQHPDTFFGVYKKHNNRANDALDLYDFFYGTYKNTEKEKILEFLKDHRDINRFKEMPQEELAKMYCELLVYSAIQKEN